MFRQSWIRGTPEEATRGEKNVLLAGMLYGWRAQLWARGFLGRRGFAGQGKCTADPPCFAGYSSVWPDWQDSTSRFSDHECCVATELDRWRTSRPCSSVAFRSVAWVAALRAKRDRGLDGARVAEHGLAPFWPPVVAGNSVVAVVEAGGSFVAPMPDATPHRQPCKPASAIGPHAGRRRWLLVVTLAVAVFSVYANTLNAPFIFDDIPGILRNPSIRDLGDLGAVLMPEPLGGSGIDGRPVANLTLALNYAVGGEEVFGYHLFNIALHVASALMLFALALRTLALPKVSAALAAWPTARSGRETTIAAGIAGLWGLHPLVTEPVVCSIHRTDGLAGLLFLCCLYGLVRRIAEPGGLKWSAVCWTSCALGMASKETMAAAPLLALLFDRAFGAATFAEAWRCRWRLYLALASTWVVLAAAMALSAQRGGSAGFGLGMGSWEYLLTQCWAIVHYLRLALWPHPLIIDYGEGLITDPLVVWPQGLLLVVLALATVWALWRRPMAGFLGAWFFGLLAPSSSIVPLVTQTIAERRMYLPLVPLVVVAVVAVARFLPRRAPAVLLAVAAALGTATLVRNRDFRTEERIWAAAAAHRPENYRAHYSLGQICDKGDRLEESVAHYQDALRLKPDHVRSHYNLAAVLATLGRLEEARVHYEAALRTDPKFTDAVVGLGTTLMRLGRVREARERFVRALTLEPGLAKNAFNLGQACFQLGELEEAIRYYRAAVRRDRGFVEAYERLGGALASAGRLEEAAGAYREAVALDADRTRSWSNLGVVLFQLGRVGDAVSAFEAALRTKPGDATIERYLAMARGEAGR